VFIRRLARHVVTDKARRQISESHKTSSKAAVAREFVQFSNIGKKRSLETRQRQSAITAINRAALTPEECSVKYGSRKGIKHTEETRAKMRESHRARRAAEC
jgi:hypothetical protein